MSMGLKLAQAGHRTNAASAALSRRANMGDPGLFGFLGKVAKTAAGFIPGPVGTIARAGIDALGGGGGQAPVPARSAPRPQGPAPQPVSWSGPQPILTRGTPGISGSPTSNGFGAGITVNPPFAGAPGVGVSTHLGPTGGSAAPQQVQPAPNGKAPSGFHWNKSSYFLKDGTFVEKGTKLVKNRRRNPLNPKAASAAIRRLESAKKAVKRLDRVAIKCKRCGCARCKC